MKGQLLKSKDTQTKIMIYYIDKQGKVTQRIITVKAISPKQIRAYCHFRKADRIFRLDSILSCGPLRKRSA